MAKLLDAAIDRVRQLPPKAQDDLAAAMHHFAEMDVRSASLTDEECAAVEQSVAQAQAQRGEFASDEQVAAVWAKHGL